jgi:hypothetical protein
LPLAARELLARTKPAGRVRSPFYEWPAPLLQDHASPET